MKKYYAPAMARMALFLACAQNMALAADKQPDWQMDYSCRNFKPVGIRGYFNLPPSFERRVGGLCFNVGHRQGEKDLPRMRAMTYGNWQPVEFEGPWGKIEGLLMDLDFGCVTVPGAGHGDCEIEDIEGDWTHNRILYSFPGKKGRSKIEMTVSRLSPAVLFRSSETKLVLMTDARSFPRYAAIPAENGTRRVDLFRETVPVSEMNDPWMLAWLADDYPLDCQRSVYSKPYKANMPVLFVFSSVPNEIYYDDGLVFAFDELMTNLAIEDGGELVNGVAVMPLYGDMFPEQSRVKSWLDAGLPADVREKCDWWRKALSDFPVTMIETHGEYDEENDVITIGQECVGMKWTELASDYFYAPVSPAFALAAEMGFPISVDGGALRDTDLVTRYGPYCVVEGAASYKIKMHGLGKYALEQRVLRDVSSVPDRVLGLLRGEIEKMLNAGRLAPWYPVSCDFGGGERWEPPVATYGQPAETIEILAATLPLLPETERAKVIEYMKRERTMSPPETVAQMPLDAGARRERHAMTAGVFAAAQKKINQTGFFALNNCVPADAVYGLASYYAITREEKGLGGYMDDARAILEPYLLRHDWAGQGWYAFRSASFGLTPGPMYLFLGGIRIYDHLVSDKWYGNGGVADANAWMKAMIGYVRMARMAGDREKEKEAWAFFGKAAALRFALGKHNGFLFKRGALPDVETCRNSVHTYSMGHHGWPYKGKIAPTNPIYIYDFRDELDYLAQVWMLNEFLVYKAYGLGTMSYPMFLHPVCPETARFMNDWLGPETHRLVERIEENMPEWYTAYCESMIGADGVNFIMPQDSHQIFMAKALVCGEKADRLAWLCDVPWVAVGDLYYINKLRETLYAYAGWEWKATGR